MAEYVKHARVKCMCGIAAIRTITRFVYWAIWVYLHGELMVTNVQIIESDYKSVSTKWVQTGTCQATDKEKNNTFMPY